VVPALFLACGDIERAEDCAQEAFVRAWQRWRKLHGADPVGWVRTVVWRLCVDDRRGHRRLSAALIRSGQPDERLASEDGIHQAAVALLSRLPRQQAAVAVLHYVEDLPVAEVAQILGIPVGTVKSRLSRARDALREPEAEILTEEVP